MVEPRLSKQDTETPQASRELARSLNNVQVFQDIWNEGC